MAKSSKKAGNSLYARCMKALAGLTTQVRQLRKEKSERDMLDAQLEAELTPIVEDAEKALAGN